MKIIDKIIDFLNDIVLDLSDWIEGQLDPIPVKVRDDKED